MHCKQSARSKRIKDGDDWVSREQFTQFLKMFLDFREKIRRKMFLIVSIVRRCGKFKAKRKNNSIFIQISKETEAYDRNANMDGMVMMIETRTKAER
uniref:EF-hand domain-containing protein n=1 Tax=Ascaris lumbricoides TaxID=6252 RepID=A0A0M3HF26_ASCLU